VKCAEFLKELTDYLDDAISPGVKRELEEHLQWCHDCEVVLNTTQKTIEIYRNNKLYELPETLRVRIHSIIMTKCKGSRPSKKTST
jgi:anti-sigma factor RsiW